MRKRAPPELEKSAISAALLEFARVSATSLPPSRKRGGKQRPDAIRLVAPGLFTFEGRALILRIWPDCQEKTVGTMTRLPSRDAGCVERHSAISLHTSTIGPRRRSSPELTSRRRNGRKAPGQADRGEFATDDEMKAALRPLPPVRVRYTAARPSRRLRNRLTISDPEISPPPSGWASAIEAYFGLIAGFPQSGRAQDVPRVRKGDGFWMPAARIPPKRRERSASSTDAPHSVVAPCA